ncbi:coiled-coil domain-containing protein 120 isoform X2 [Protopterus annectens]|uniref:coiled-coil domain-containing protein 120 isoform X2 n=1 Tax=Protopterus annectens TaxID=7888 RepID=UPI001CFC010A|nr:coiled-coil domain-containing protein 120 isoform X2 [Protopterus annectens]
MAFNQPKHSPHQNRRKAKTSWVKSSSCTDTLKGSESQDMEVKGQLIVPTEFSTPDSPHVTMRHKLKVERIRELMERQNSLQEALNLKLKELKKVCLQEAELTGRLPSDYPLEPGERMPYISRRKSAVYRSSSSTAIKESQLEELEREFVVQKQVTEEARRQLSLDLSADQFRKKKQVYAIATKRLQEIENLIKEYKIKYGKKLTQWSSQALQVDSKILGTSLLPDKLSPSRTRAQGLDRSPDHRHGRKLSPMEIYNELRTRRNSVASSPSPTKTLPRSVSSLEGRSVPATPVMPRNTYGTFHARPEGGGLSTKQWSGSQDSQMGYSGENGIDSPSKYAARTRRSNSSEALLDRSFTGDQLVPDGYPYGMVKLPFKSSEALSDKSSSNVSSGSPKPKKSYHSPEHIYEAPASMKPGRTSYSSTGVCKQMYSEVLLDYFIEKQQARMWNEPDGRHFSPATNGLSPHLNDLSRCRQIHNSNSSVYMDSPMLRSRAEERRGKVARTKSCGPYIPAKQEPPHPHYSHELAQPTHALQYTSRSSMQQRSPVPAEVSRSLHKALALEGLRDWYIRNAVGYRPHVDRRQQYPHYPDQQHQDHYYCYSPSLSHSVSFNGPAMPTRHYNELLYRDDPSGRLQDLSVVDKDLSLDAEVTPPGTLV